MGVDCMEFFFFLGEYEDAFSQHYKYARLSWSCLETSVVRCNSTGQRHPRNLLIFGYLCIDLHCLYSMARKAYHLRFVLK